MTVIADAQNIRDSIITVSDFPTRGVSFKDITPLVGNHVLFQTSISLMRDAILGWHIPADKIKIVGLEARGFLFAAPLSLRLECPLILFRKSGKLPRECHKVHTINEYSGASFEFHKDSISPGDHVVVVDDVLATGGTLSAINSAVLAIGAVPYNLTLIGLDYLNGASKITVPLRSILNYEY